MSHILKYYLAKAGQVTGPYTDEDIRGLEQRGEIFSYSWIWKPSEKAWKPLDPAPTLNPEVPRSSVQGDLSTSEAYCVVGGGVLKGSLRNATELGFELRMHETWTLPPVGKGMQIQVLRQGDFDGGRLEMMKILEIAREDKEWVLFLRHNT